MISHGNRGNYEKVIAPQSLQDAVMEQIEKMQKNYDNLTK